MFFFPSKSHEDLCQVVLTITAFGGEIRTYGCSPSPKFSVNECLAAVV